jgi:HK97 gp10 family phage protein
MSDMLKMKFTDTSTRIIADMAKYPAQVEREVEKKLGDIGLAIRNNIIEKMTKTKRSTKKYRRGQKWHHPSVEGFPPARDTGNLVNSFEIYRQGGRLEVGTNVIYAKFLEKGTRKMEARPFLKAGMDGIDIERMLLDAIQRGFGQ